jgi:MarR family 2-MHQ and catechol resistance regulon transcriptional repressor
MQAPTGLHTWLVLWKAHTAVRAFAVRHIETLGLTLTDFAILEALLHKGPLPVNELGRKVALTSGSITTAVDRLQTRAFVERKGADSDKRARMVHLTEVGRKHIDAAFQKHAHALNEVGAVLTPAERETLVGLLKKFGRAAEDKTGGAGSEAQEDQA